MFFSEKKNLDPDSNIDIRGLGGEFRIRKIEPCPEFTGLSTFASRSFVQDCDKCLKPKS